MNKSKRWESLSAGCVLIIMCSCSGTAIKPEQTGSVYEITVTAVFDHLYDSAYKLLEESNMFVVKELNIAATLKRNKKKWGDNYNKNGYEEVRTLVLCNPWYANEVLNRTPRLMTLCPLAVSFLHKEGETTILYGYRAPLAEGTSSYEIFREIDSTIISAIKIAASLYK
ncbi:MAG: hypothetical protein ACI9SC_002033 [Gammaproteobacteria bacterium]|jgi:uncharacterized protein (DUF302 family)